MWDLLVELFRVKLTTFIQGNTGKNAKKRFIHLKRKGAETVEPPTTPSPSPHSAAAWTDLASVVNPRIAPIMLEQGVRKVQKKNGRVLDLYQLKLPWKEMFKER